MMTRGLALFLIVFVLMAGVCAAAEPKNSKLDSSVYQVENYLEEVLNDPDSYKGIEWSKVVKKGGDPCYWVVRHKYRAKNRFGGYVIKNQLFCIDKEGKVRGAADFK
jgi:hypothetical protein